MPDIVTMDQIRDLIKSENIRPSDIFPMDKLIADPGVKGFAEDRVRERIGSEYQHRKSLEEEVEKIKKEYGPKEAAFLEQIKALKADAAKAQIGPLFEKQKGTRKLDERQVKFIQERLSRFNPQKPEEIEKEFNAHLDSEIDEFSNVAKILGIDNGKGKTEEKVEDGGTGPDETKKGGAPENKYLDPAQNPMIKMA